MVERVRPATPGQNVTDGTRMEALGECTASYLIVQEASEAAKSARGVHSANLKKWKGRGVLPAALARAIKDRLLDPAEVLAELHEYTRMRALQNMPSIQQDLAAMWTEVDVDDEKAAEIQRQRWHDDGAFAGRQGVVQVDNPHVPGSEAWASWDDGWRNDQERIATAMGAGAPPIVNASRGRPARKQTAQRQAATAAGNGTSKPRGRRRAAADEHAA